MSERLNKTSICSIVFLDIVGYSQKPVSEQIEYKNRFNALISESIKNVAQNDRIILDTGDGAAITLLGEPESALFISLTIRDRIHEHNRNHPESPLEVRIGINLGPVQVVKDINNHLNVIGDGINVAQRVMSFAEPNQILVSRSYYEIVSRLTNDMLKMFSYSGVKHDKHVREHEVYVLRTAGDAQAAVMPPLETSVLARRSDGASRKTLALIVIVLALLAAVLIGVVAWEAKKAPTGLPAQPPVAAVSPAAPVTAPAPAATKAAEPLPAVKPQGGADTTTKNEKPKAKSERKAEDSAAAVSASAAQHASPPKQKTHEQKKSGLDKFKESVKQGSEKPACTDAMRSLNQCK